MHAQIELSSGRTYDVDLGAGIDVSIPLDFAGEQPNVFGAPLASASRFSISGYVLDTRQGGSCNVSIVSINPHCNGTHTESIGHIVDDGPPIVEVAPTGLIGATLISVEPEHASATADHYTPGKRVDDILITKRCLKPLESIDDRSLLEALVVRTIPNDAGKLTRDYARRFGPYFSIEAAEYLRELEISHLLVDMASVDRADDEGRLRIHHIWFGVPDRSSTPREEGGSHRTITEMIYVEDSVPDGGYLLQLQIAPFVLDASPSRPVLFPMRHSS